MKAFLLALTVAAGAFPALGAEARVANDMSCAQAQATYQRNGRVYVRTYAGDVVPIYGLRNSCPIGYSASAYYIRTLDQSTCVLGYRCRPRGSRGHR